MRFSEGLFGLQWRGGAVWAAGHGRSKTVRDDGMCENTSRRHRGPFSKASKLRYFGVVKGTPFTIRSVDFCNPPVGRCQLARQLRYVGYEIGMQVPNELPVETEFRFGNIGCYRLIAE
jgi:hypothetical protein